MRPICGRKRATKGELSELPSNIFGDAGALSEEGHELGSRVVFFQLRFAGDEDFAVLAEVVLVVVFERVATDAVVALKGEGERFEFGMAARAGVISEALESDGTLGKAGLAGDGSGVDGRRGIVDGATEDIVEDEEASGDHGGFVATDSEEAALGEKAAAFGLIGKVVLSDFVFL